MPLRVESPRLRRIAERNLHLAALVILAVLLWHSIVSRTSAPNVESGSDSLSRALVHWSTSAAPRGVHVDVRSDISPAQRDWLGALEGAGTHVSWSGQRLAPLAAEADRAADPQGITRVWSAAPPGRMITIGDPIGPLDSVVARDAGGRFALYSAPGVVRVAVGPLIARVAVIDSLSLKRLLVLGRVGWEAKFVIAALEERGWKVDARLSLSPKGDVMQTHSALAVDTSRYSAVIALDSSASDVAPRILGYVRAGGGLILSASAAAAPAFAGAGIGSLGIEARARMPFDSIGSDPRRSLALIPIRAAANAVAIERRDSLVAVAARRLERGRVIVSGYEDTWRWRMAGGEDAVDAHRDWWAGLVAAVAFAGHTSLGAPIGTDEAPYAHLVGRLGPPSVRPAGSSSFPRIPTSWLFALFSLALMTAWASRRLRGAA
jgi:hypothetical protein